jgi:hypothetical protein
LPIPPPLTCTTKWREQNCWASESAPALAQEPIMKQLDPPISASFNDLNNYIDRIQFLSRAQHFMYRSQTTMEKIMEELAKIPPEED